MTNFYPFGMEQQERSASAGNTRWGYNGMLKDNDIKGEGNSYDYGERWYDPRIGRFLRIDKFFKCFPDWNPYRFGFCNPIFYIDSLGLLETTYVNEKGNTLIAINDGIKDDKKDIIIIPEAKIEEFNKKINLINEKRQLNGFYLLKKQKNYLGKVLKTLCKHNIILNLLSTIIIKNICVL